MQGVEVDADLVMRAACITRSPSYFSMWPPDLILSGRIPSNEVMMAVHRRHPSLNGQWVTRLPMIIALLVYVCCSATSEFPVISCSMATSCI
jgi:hypothetical protein